MIAEVIINEKVNELNRTFDYIVPDDFEVEVRCKSIGTIWD